MHSSNHAGSAAVTIVSLVAAPLTVAPARPASGQPASPAPSAGERARAPAEPVPTVDSAASIEAVPSTTPQPMSIDATPVPIDGTGTSPPELAELSPPVAGDPSEALDAGSDIGSEQTSMNGTPDEYRPLVLAILDRAKRYPLVARRWGLEGVVDIAFTIHPNGRLSDPELITSSNHQVLDDAALALVRRVRVVPPPPTRSPMRFSALIQYQVDR
jgi:protein TonB